MFIVINDIRNTDDDVIPLFKETIGIPKIIHQIYIGGVVPQQLLEISKKLRDNNPAWEYRFYDENRVISFIRDNYGEKMLEYYNRINPQYGAARVDLCRYLVMYRYGGVYLDLKSTFTRAIDDVLLENDKYLLCGWQNLKGQPNYGGGIHKELSHLPEGEFQQWHIIAAAGSPLLREVIKKVLKNIDEYRPWRFGVGKPGVLRVTGPITYTLAIYPLLKKYPYRYARFDKEFGLLYSGLNNNEQHMQLMQKHYSDLRIPIVEMTGIYKWLSFIYLARKRCSKYLRDKIKKYKQ